ncbi:MAG TPA: inorganic phosphate transporter [Verrucomicrobiota bacterium]|nr:inorganic phosphate transporter [Verrucomicrobiales bacterium]HRI11692.1 inorganic phosphate transporter [Verrucomicrobiota bacterium]
MTLLLSVVFVALVFEYINGFHDTANSIATVVSTKVLTPRQAIVLAAGTNLLGALVGDAVAKTVSSGLVDATYVTSTTLICALLGGIIWNLVTWWFGLPSSSSHALVGGLCGATLASAHTNWGAIIWARHLGGPWYKDEGLLYKVILPMFTSPVAGLILGFLLMTSLFLLLRNWRPRMVNAVFGKLQLGSAAYMGFAHGSNDAQKTMGIIALALVAGTQAGTLDQVPPWLEFLRHPMHHTASGKDVIAPWIKVMCALTMAAGTAAGGWRIIRTMGHRMVRLQPVNGFAAETTAATVLLVAARLGMPVSTTHAITTSIMGVGMAKRWRALNLTVVEQILWAWFLTLPMTAVLGYVLRRLTM